MMRTRRHRKKNRYFVAGDVSIAVNLKVASASIARATIKAHHPKLEISLQTGTDYPKGRSADNSRLQSMCPRGDGEGKRILLVREPVERFRSACAECSIVDVDAKLKELEAGWGIRLGS
jgi:hypothetical protein